MIVSTEWQSRPSVRGFKWQRTIESAESQLELDKMQSILFFLDSIIVRLRVHDPMWHLYSTTLIIYCLPSICSFDLTIDTSLHLLGAWHRDQLGVRCNGVLSCARVRKWLVGEAYMNFEVCVL